MTLREYIEQLQELAKEQPESLDFEVIYSRDDEGNGFQKVSFEPSVGHFDGDYRGEFEPEGTYEEEFESNAVCIN